MFRKNLREMLDRMGIGNDLDDEVLDSLQKQLFTFLEFDDSLAGGITFKTGSILTTLQVKNYQMIREQIGESYRKGEPATKIKLQLIMTTLCLYLQEDQRCQVTNEHCEFQKGTRWHQCEIVQSSCQTLEDWT